MKQFPGIDYDFRPEDYWLDKDVLHALVRNVKGAHRRKIIKAYYEAGNYQELDETFSKTTLSEEERQHLARLHPTFMGGEYLPDYGANETEIARIELKSTLADVISIRAQLDEDQTIKYSIVDEHTEEFKLWTEWSAEPFTLGELIEFIDNSETAESSWGGLSLCFNNSNAEHMDREDLVDFTTISSEIYPELQTHYSEVFSEWAKADAEKLVS